MTIQKFRNMDLIFLAVVAIISDLLLSLFGLIGIRLFLSIAYPLVIISYIRWNHYGFLSNIVLMLLHVILYGIIANVEWPITLLHSISTLGFTSMLLMIKLTKQDKRSISRQMYLLIYLVSFLSVFFLEWTLYNVFGFELNLVSHGFNHILNLLFGMFIIFIASFQKDILINMKYYFIHKEKEV